MDWLRPVARSCRVLFAMSTTADAPDRRFLDQPLLTADDVAHLLTVPRSSVYEYARRTTDPIPSVLIGRHRRFQRDDVEGWVQQQSQALRMGAVGKPG